jgi:hypothetical protein
MTIDLGARRPFGARHMHQRRARTAARITRRLGVVAAIVMVTCGALPALPASATPPAWSITSSTTPETWQLTGVQCPTTSVCFSVGETYSDISVVRTSTDGGTTWTTTATMLPSVELQSLTCTSATACVAVANEGTDTVVTMNGWSTWSVQAVPLGNAIQGLSCVAPATCAASAFNAYGKATFLLSPDGGVSWAVHQVPRDSAGEFAIESTAVACTSSLRCVMAGITAGKGEGGVPIELTTLFRTTSGGRSWTSFELPAVFGELFDMACPSATRCYATGTSKKGAVIFASTNAGATWKLVLSWATLGQIDALSCPAAGVCEAIGSDTFTAPTAVRTTSGGAHWSRHRLSRTGYFAPAVACASVPDCIVTGTFPTSDLEQTTDGGTAWTAADVEPVEPTPSDLSCPVVGTCEASVTGTFFGSDLVNTVERTTDDGTTWQTQTLPSDVTVVNDVTCSSSTVCLVAATSPGLNSRPILFTTTDGGTTWGSVNLPSAVFEVNSITCASTLDCIASTLSTIAGQGGAVPYYTTDGGTTWTAGTLPIAPKGVSYYFGDVACTSTTACVASGEAAFNGGFSSVATFFSTSNDGATWTAVSLQGSGEFDSSDLPGSMSCSSATTCVSVGLNYPEFYSWGELTPQVAVFVTTDGGATWTDEHSIGAQLDDATNVQCASGGWCEMVASDADNDTSYGLTSLDGGVTWSTTPMPVTWSSSISLSCPIENSCVTSGALTTGALGVAALS